MKNKKILITIISIIIIVISAVIIFVLFRDDSINSELDMKISELKLEMANEELEPINDKYYAFISVSDSKTKAYVRNGRGATVEESIDNAEKQISKIINEEKVEPNWVKLDVVYNTREIETEEELAAILCNNKETFSRGITFDEDFNIAFLPLEIYANKIVDFADGVIKVEAADMYINSVNKGLDDSLENYNKVIFFDCISYIYDENGISKLVDDDDINHRRYEKVENKEDILEIIDSSSKYLFENINDDGSFVYNYDVTNNSESDIYNILRHEGSIWSMIQVYSLKQDESMKEKIEAGLKYVIENAIVYKDNDTAFLKEIDENELKLGANGLAIIMFTEYMDVFDSTEYEDLIKKIGNGILEMQEDDGSYYHVYAYPSFNKKEEFRTSYYDGEATFGLLRLYEFTQDEKWLEAAEKSMDYFVDNDYIKYRDQWLEYSVNEIIDYIPKKEYFEFGLKNITENYEGILNYTNLSATNLELLATGIEIYDKAVTNEIDIGEFDTSLFMYAIETRIQQQLNGYFYPEIAMYFEEPSKILDTFFQVSSHYITEYGYYVSDTDDDESESNKIYSTLKKEYIYRIRIDDVQHNLNGLYSLYKNDDLIQKYAEN